MAEYGCLKLAIRELETGEGGALLSISLKFFTYDKNDLLTARIIFAANYPRPVPATNAVIGFLDLNPNSWAIEPNRR